MSGDIKYEQLRLVMEELGKEFVQELKDQIVKQGKVASGDLLNSIGYHLIKSNNGYTIEITADNYLTYVDRGRKPGKMPPSQKLVPWVQSKGIKLISQGKKMTEEQAAFVIARSIGEKGIKPTNIIETTRKILLQKYESKIKEAMSKDYIMYIKEIII